MEIAQAVDFSTLYNEQGLSGGKLNIGLTTTFGSIISTLLPYIFTAAGLGLLIFLIFGGISMMLSRGEPKALEAAKAKITGALTGFIILFISYWLVQIVGQVLGITAITNIFH
jgi:hypothetical protein